MRISSGFCLLMAGQSCAARFIPLAHLDLLSEYATFGSDCSAHYSTIWPLKMDPVHASSPETRLELIEKMMREHEACFAMTTVEIQQATTLQVEGLATLTSQVQQLMAAFTTVTVATLPPPSSSSSGCNTIASGSQLWSGVPGG